ncbi:hypothetical protein [Nonomuraea sp. B19D2]|uniref:hypothetical protein n=1 Tax=Nonomuraea sp. B19D2 TaxID=3159561 RepID=UPI0032DB9D62
MQCHVHSAPLTHAAAAVEIGGSLAAGATALVLLAWAMAGLVLALPILYRMAGHELGA